jgi:protein-disulfide isomerase
MAEKLTKKEKRELSRQERKQKLEQLNKQRKARKIKALLAAGTVVVLIAALITYVVLFAPKPVEQITPVNLANNGITLVEGKVLETEAPISGSEPTPLELRDDRVEIEIYLDYLCPYCKMFDETQKDVIEKYFTNKDVVFSFHPVAFLSEYSMVATNASACIAGKQPDLWWRANNAIYAGQPEEGAGQGYSLDKSINTVKTSLSGLNLNDDTIKCIETTPYAQWAADSTNAVLQKPVPNSSLSRISGTPTVLIDGIKLELDFTKDSANFDIAIQNALSNAKNS